MLIYINFSFDFLGLHNVDFENYFANKLTNMGRFLSHCSRALSDIKRSACAWHFISDKALLYTRALDSTSTSKIVRAHKSRQKTLRLGNYSKSWNMFAPPARAKRLQWKTVFTGLLD